MTTNERIKYIHRQSSSVFSGIQEITEQMSPVNFTNFLMSSPDDPPITTDTRTDFNIQNQESEEDIDGPEVGNELSGVANEGEKEQLRTIIS